MVKDSVIKSVSQQNFNCIEELKYKIEDNLLFCLRNNNSMEFLQSHASSDYDALENFIMRKAGRIRPTLLVLTYLGYTDTAEQEMIFKLCNSLELLHSFALIHDDILDNSEKRGKAPSLHTALNKNKKNIISSDKAAMLLGDVIYSIALDEISKLTLPESIKTKIFNLFTHTIAKTTDGQLRDIVLSRHIPGITKNEVLKLYDLKTAEYSFCLPMKLGSLLTGGNEKELQILYKCGLSFGRAYQIIDDINDFSIAEFGSYNIISALLWKESNFEEKKKIRSICLTQNLENVEEFIKEKIEKYKILSKAADSAYFYKEDGISELWRTALKEDVKEEIINYIEKIMVIRTTRIKTKKI